MNVLFLSHKYLPSKGGIENSIYYLAKEYSKTQANVTVLTTGYGPQLEGLPASELVDGALVKRVPWRGFSSFLLSYEYIYNSNVFASEIEKHIQSEAPDLVIARDIFSARAALRAGLSNNLIYIAPSNLVEQETYRVASWKGTATNKQRVVRLYLKFIMWPMFRVIQKDVLQGASCVVCWSLWLKENLATVSSKANVKQINPGVATTVFDKKSWKRKFRICSLGRMDPVKNIAFLIKSMEFVDQRVTLELTLSGSSTEDIERLIQVHGVSNRVVVLPETHDVCSRYDNADLFLMPSLYEPFGQTIIEAMGRGLPVLALIPNAEVQTASAQIITEGVNGYLVKNSPLSFANAINRYYELNDSEAMKMALDSHLYVSANYRWNDTAEKLTELLLNDREIDSNCK